MRANMNVARDTFRKYNAVVPGFGIVIAVMSYSRFTRHDPDVL